MPQKPRALIIQAHGNAENMSTHFQSVAWLAKAGHDVLVFDYRGFGASAGTACVSGAIADTARVLNYAHENVGAQPIIIYGQSIGAVFSIYVASQPIYREMLKGLIIESAFSSYRSIVRDKLQEAWFFYPASYPLSWFFSDHFAPYRHIAKIGPRPILILAAKQDPIVPYYHSGRLYTAAAEPKKFFETKLQGHIMATNDSASRAEILAFIAAAQK